MFSGALGRWNQRMSEVFWPRPKAKTILQHNIFFQNIPQKIKNMSKNYVKNDILRILHLVAGPWCRGSAPSRLSWNFAPQRMPGFFPTSRSFQMFQTMVWICKFRPFWTILTGICLSFFKHPTLSCYWFPAVFSHGEVLAPQLCLDRWQPRDRHISRRTGRRGAHPAITGVGVRK